MAGIYVHIPFCRSRCIYCDFFSTTDEEKRDAYVSALCNEIRFTAQTYPHTRAHTIYIGGGTPSQLSPTQLDRILSTIEEHFPPFPDTEITIEMNPDDIEEDVKCRMEDVKCSMFNVQWSMANRLSLGIQTFDDQILRFLRRHHDSATAVKAVRSLQDAGIKNISIDLIYGLPGQTMEVWQRDLDIAFSLGIQHLSAYALSFEEGTPLWQMREQGRVAEADEALSVAMYEALCDRAEAAGFRHYEISNFALPGFESRHNSSYWTGKPYFGFGPGAHSYDGDRTRWSNRPNLGEYLKFWGKSPSAGVLPPTGGDREGPQCSMSNVQCSINLTLSELYNEFVMCGLRTCEGVDLNELEARFGQSRLEYILRMAAPHIADGRLLQSEGRLRLTRQALMVSDDVMSDLMVI